jgi:hypothetical protein
VTHCEAPLRHYRVTGTRKGNRTYFEDNKGRRWMMIEEPDQDHYHPPLKRLPLASLVSSSRTRHFRPPANERRVKGITASSFWLN